MIDQALEVLKTDGPSALIDFLTDQEDAQEMVSACLDLARTLYNKEKDVPTTIHVSRLGIQQALDSAAALGDDEESAAAAYKLRSTAKAISYNLGANLWPGWDDEGVTIDQESMAVGMEAAHTNLRLGEELQKEPLPLSRAHWLIGAHEMALGNMDAARERFGRASSLAESVDAEGDNLLNQAYTTVTQLLEEPNNPDALAQLEDLKGKLAQLEHGEFYVGQVEAALRVFS